MQTHPKLGKHRNAFLKKDPKMETAEPFSTDEDEAGPLSTSTPKVPSWTPKDSPRTGQGLAGPKQKLVSQAPNPAQTNIVEKCERIREELESRAQEVKIDLIRAIRRAQTAAKRRKNMDKAQGKIEPWALTHVANQGKKKARTADKKANRANPKGKRYLPKLDNQYESSVTYTSDSADSIPEVVWDSNRPQGPQKPQKPTQNSKQMPGSARELKRSI